AAQAMDLFLGALRQGGGFAQRRDAVSPRDQILVAVALEDPQLPLVRLDGVSRLPGDAIALEALRAAELLEARSSGRALGLDPVDLLERLPDRGKVGEEAVHERQALLEPPALVLAGVAERTARRQRRGDAHLLGHLGEIDPDQAIADRVQPVATSFEGGVA